MKEIPVADQVLATIGAVLWSVQVIPQIIKSHRTKSTDGLSPALMFIWACATIFQGSYLVSMRSSIPLQIQPQAFGGLGVVSWGQCLYYGKRYSLRKTLTCVFSFYIFFAAFETGSVYALWAGERRGITWPMQMYGWITSALLILGLMPQYWEIYKHKEVVGISIIFMLVDIGGGVFSGISLFFRRHFDATAFVQYFLVVVLDGIVVLLALVLNPLAKKRRAREAALADAENSAGVEDSAEVGEARACNGRGGPTVPSDTRSVRDVDVYGNDFVNYGDGEDTPKPAFPDRSDSYAPAYSDRSDSYAPIVTSASQPAAPESEGSSYNGSILGPEMRVT